MLWRYSPEVATHSPLVGGPGITRSDWSVTQLLQHPVYSVTMDTSRCCCLHWTGAGVAKEKQGVWFSFMRFVFSLRPVSWPATMWEPAVVMVRVVRRSVCHMRIPPKPSEIGIQLPGSLNRNLGFPIQNLPSDSRLELRFCRTTLSIAEDQLSSRPIPCFVVSDLCGSTSNKYADDMTMVKYEICG